MWNPLTSKEPEDQRLLTRSPWDMNDRERRIRVMIVQRTRPDLGTWIVGSMFMAGTVFNRLIKRKGSKQVLNNR